MDDSFLSTGFWSSNWSNNTSKWLPVSREVCIVVAAFVVGLTLHLIPPSSSSRLPAEKSIVTIAERNARLLSTKP